MQLWTMIFLLLMFICLFESFWKSTAVILDTDHLHHDSIRYSMDFSESVMISFCELLWTHFVIISSLCGQYESRFNPKKGVGYICRIT